MYIPLGATTLEHVKFPQIRLGLQGEAGTGKTTSALTFPNPVVMDIDNGLTAFSGRADILRIPLYDGAFISSLNDGRFRDKKADGFVNYRDAILWWIHHEAAKLEENQTLIIDSWTALQNWFDTRMGSEPVFSKKGEIDDYAFWEKKIAYSKTILDLTQTLRCHVVVNFHEAKERDKVTGALLDKVQPLMQGKFVTYLKKYFSDFFRSKVIQTKDPKTGAVIDAKYVWQVRSDNQFDAKTRLTKIPSGTIYTDPTFEIFKQYGYEQPTA